jgi:hypothetical protein
MTVRSWIYGIFRNRFMVVQFFLMPQTHLSKNYINSPHNYITPTPKNPLLLYQHAKKNSNIIPHTYLRHLRIRNRHQ